MTDVPDDLRRRLTEAGQEHVLIAWDRLADADRQGLLNPLRALDLGELRDLYARRDEPAQLPPVDRIEPLRVVGPTEARGPAVARGEAALREGRVAVVLVAGGQGTRLGFDKPKGMYPVGPVSGKSLFQVHAEKVLAVSRRYGQPVPLLVMTSDATHDETVAYFEEHSRFGLPAGGVTFFRQGTMPALDLATGRLLLEGPGRLALSPDGHGGTLTALAEQGLLDRLREQGITQLFYFQVDNPLVKIADPAFLGHHLAAGAEVSTKVVPKLGPSERMGVLAQIEGKCTIIEYSDLTSEQAARPGADGRLLFWAGNTAIHLFDRAFLERVTRGGEGLPFHLARKKVPHLGPDGVTVQPAKENALKFERFIFDVLPLAQRWTVVETVRAEEFAPLKNATGADSPETVRQALIDQAGRWLTRAGVRFPHDAGKPSVAVEVSPLLALDADELARRLPAGTTVDGERYLDEGLSCSTR